MRRKASISHDEAIVKELRADPEFAAEYLKAAIEEAEDEPRVLLIALRRIAEARGGLAKVAKAGRNRKGEPVSRPLTARESAVIYACRCDESDRD